MKIADITPAPWNTRTAITEESVRSLAASMQGDGLIQPISVCGGENGHAFICYDGNRRLAAAKLLGWTEIEANVAHITIEEAKVRTVTANMQREADDPLLVADVIASLLTTGMSESAIAAKLGRSVAWVRRREGLMRLCENLQKRVKECPGRFSIVALEMVSLLPEKAQDMVAGRVAASLQWSDWTFTEKEARNEIDRVSQDLDVAHFTEDAAAREKCEKCPMRTGVTPDLFGIVDGKLGRCLNAKCFAQCRAAHEEAQIAAKIPAKVESVRLDYPWQAPSGCGKKRTKAMPCAYYTVRDGVVEVQWGPSKRQIDADKKAQQERAAERNAERKRYDDLSERIGDALHMESEGVPDGLVGAVTKYVSKDVSNDERAYIIDIITSWITQWHGDEEKAEMLSRLPFLQTIAGLTDDEKNYFVNHSQKENS